MNERRSCKKVTAGLMALIMTAGMLNAGVGSFASMQTVTASAMVVKHTALYDDEIVTDEETTADGDVMLSEEMTELNSANYFVDGGVVTIDSVITVKGEVNLTLNNGAELIAANGIVIEEGGVLNVYGDGVLTATGAPNAGTNQYGHNAIKGTINIYSGTVNATASDSAQGYGSTGWLHGNTGIEGVAAIDGDITIYGGTLIAKGGNAGDGGDGWYAGNGGHGGYALAGNITINGGNFKLEGGKGGEGRPSSGPKNSGYTDGQRGEDGAAFAPDAKVVVNSSNVSTSKTPEIVYEKGSGCAKLTWTAVAGAEKYAVAAFQNGSWTLLDQGYPTSYVLNGLKAGTEYKVAVIAMFNGEWNMDFTNAITVTANPAKNEMYPKVSNIEYSKATHQFRLNWNAVDGASQYGIATKVAGKWKIVSYTDKTTFTSPKLTAGSTYELLVCAKVDGKWDISSMSSRVFTVTVK